MIDHAVKRGINFGTVTVEACVSAALRDLGHEIRTYGPLMHECYAGVLGPLLKYHRNFTKPKIPRSTASDFLDGTNPQ